MLFKDRWHLTVTPLWSVMDENGKPASSRCIRVTGLENADEEMIKTTFESRILSGGETDSVEEVLIAPDCKSAIVIFKTTDSKYELIRIKIQRNNF